MVTKTEKKKTRNPLEEFSWLNELPAWQKDACVEFLKKNPNLPKDHEKVKRLSDLSIESKMNIEATLEQNEDRVSIEVNKKGTQDDWAYASGALKAFSEGDYHCPLIHKFLSKREINYALR